MAKKNKRPVINAETVIIHADEVIVIEANDRRRHRRNDRNDVAGVEDRRRHRRNDMNDVAGVEDRRHHHDTDVLGAEDNQPRRYFPW